MAGNLSRDVSSQTIQSSPREPRVDPANSPPRRRTRTLMAVLVAAAVVLGALIALFVITQDDDDVVPAPTATTTAPTATTTAPSPSASSSTTTEPPTPEAAAIASAEAVYRDYLRVSGEIATAGDGDAAALEAVAIGEELSEAKVAVENYNLAGITQVGQLGVASLEPQSVSLASEDGAVPEVILDACLDLTEYDVVQDGESVLDPNAPDRAASIVTVRNYADRGGWLVARVAAEGASC